MRRAALAALACTIMMTGCWTEFSISAQAQNLSGRGSITGERFVAAASVKKTTAKRTKKKHTTKTSAATASANAKAEAKAQEAAASQKMNEAAANSGKKEASRVWNEDCGSDTGYWAVTYADGSSAFFDVNGNQIVE